MAELNGRSPDEAEFVPTYEIAPGIKPGAWVFAPKSRGMATVNREDLTANRLLRLPSAPRQSWPPRGRVLLFPLRVP